jgi:iron-sulfur cluster repair protein YtfE (RIC family)
MRNDQKESMRKEYSPQLIKDLLIKHHNAIGYLLKEFASFADKLEKHFIEASSKNEELVKALNEIKEQIE